MDYNKEIWELRDQGKTPSYIARKLKIDKSIVYETIGNANNKGLGDVIEKVTEATGIKAVVEAISDDCGCAARKESLNDLFPNRKLNDLLVEDFEYLTEFFSRENTSVDMVTQKELVRIYNGVFNAKRKVSNCSPCVATIVRELKKVYIRATQS